MKLPKLAWFTAYAGLVLLAFQYTSPGWTDLPPAMQMGEQFVGTWQVELGDQTGMIVITPTGQVYILNKTAQGEMKAIEIGRVVQKLSPKATLPPNAKVTSLAERFIQQSIQAKQSEAKQYIGSMNRSEQAFFLETDRFTTSLNALGFGIKPETENYRYRIFLLHNPRANRPEFKKAVWSIALPKKPNLKSYAGVVWVTNITKTNEGTTATILCESNQPTAQIPPAPTFQVGENGLEANCPKGFSLLQLR
ncbi:type IV pilin-like G/H family protein [Phormidium sp. CLA17]|uniref:type IV pilin-like G/H family protein n=1 Tax=Leptolyngbya sp. Cla-17 TaxID=2803751 RepID=UPI0014910B14|nr:type IV pilin-like G/H family protein [Leptolyngbya sp. Cla-17]MBM0743902.1 type IV pilin-like G/H family protein [Leptolyngbya sp. Cla-17]